MIIFFNCFPLQACDDIDTYFTCKVMEPRLVIFENEDSILQMFITGENDNLMELPTSSVGAGVAYLMAFYYIFNIEYPKQYQPLLFFFQDFIIDKADNGKRPSRYASFASTMSITI